MWRSVYMAAIVYACGAPGWDGYRPATLDRPLQAFYRQVNTAAEQGRTLFGAANAARGAYVKAYLTRAEKQLHVPNEALAVVGTEQAATDH
jgi:hypothetical protein